MQHWQIVNLRKQVTNNSAEELWQNACNYFKWCDEHAIETQKTITSGKEAGKIVKQYSIRMYNIRALCLHCNVDEEYMRSIRRSKTDDSPFFIVVSKIMYIIYVQNLENAVVGEFNSIMISKVLNMDRSGDDETNKVAVHIVHGLPALSKSENEILEKLDLENEEKIKRESENLNRAI